MDERAVIGRCIPGDDGVAIAVARIASLGRAAWPAVAIADDAIAARIARLVRDDPDAPLDELQAADFYLATALAIRDGGALRAFEAELVPEIQVALRRLRLPPAEVEEITQALRSELLTGDDPKIASYAGRGGLVAWLQVSATRKAFKRARHTVRERPLDEVLLDHWPDPAPGPAARHLRDTYTAALKTAIREAFGALEIRQRNLLRQHFLDELTIDDLARMYRAHRSTCARWLADARAELTRRTRTLLIGALGLHRRARQPAPVPRQRHRALDLAHPGHAMTACPPADQLLGFAAGDLSGEVSASVEAHIDGCADCRRALSSAARGSPRGASLGRYRIDDVLGAGGMGIVYRAWDPQLARPVAIKVVKQASRDPAQRARLVREAQSLARLSHPHVCQVHDVGTEGDDGDEVWVAMELIEGTTLRRWADPPRDAAELLEALLGAAEGLAAAHAAGIVHRDVKPENVLITRDGRAVVTDFGLARVEPPVDPEGSTLIGDAGLTATGILVGTPAYLAPEQLTGSPIDARVDQFAWAVMAWELLTGMRRPGRRRGAARAARGIPAGPASARRAPACGPGHRRRVVDRRQPEDPPRAPGRWRSRHRVELADRRPARGVDRVSRAARGPRRSDPDVRGLHAQRRHGGPVHDEPADPAGAGVPRWGGPSRTEVRRGTCSP